MRRFSCSVNETAPGGTLRVWVADTPLARLLGLAFLDRIEGGLLIPRCRSVHTFGMRFAIDLVFVDRDGRVLAVRESLPPRRFVRTRTGSAVLELPAGEARRLGLAT